MMKVKDLYIKVLSALRQSEIETPETEARYIICEVLGFSLSEFFLKSDSEVNPEMVSLILSMCKRRINGEPIQYIIGSWDFMGRTFKVGEGVLIPRPETELLCEKIADKLKEKGKAVVYDLCSGSGCIGLTLKCECPEIELYAIEKSEKALFYLTENAKKLCNDINIIKGDVLDIALFKDLPQADIIVSNPPYIKSGDIPFLQKEVTFEPEMALDGGEDGLIFYRYITKKWSEMLKKDGEMFFEISEDQGEALISLFDSIGFDSRVIKDYNNHDRIVEGRKA